MYFTNLVLFQREFVSVDPGRADCERPLFLDSSLANFQRSSTYTKEEKEVDDPWLEQARDERIVNAMRVIPTSEW